MRYGLAILIIIFLAIVGSVVLLGRGDSSGPAVKAARITKLAAYSGNTNASVSWMVQGRVVGEDVRRSIRITVTPNTRREEIIDGYQGNVEKTKEQSNNLAAFTEFTHALDGLGFGRERTVKQADERGMCPLGNRFIYRLTDGTKEVMRTWSDTCSRADGPFGGGTTTSSIEQLFKAQITDYPKFTSGVIL